mgnify:CR=1 FL=1
MHATPRLERNQRGSGHFPDTSNGYNLGLKAAMHAPKTTHDSVLKKSVVRGENVSLWILTLTCYVTLPIKYPRGYRNNTD